MATSGTTEQVFQLEDVLRGMLEVVGAVDPGESLPEEDRATALKVLQSVGAEFHAKFGKKIWQQGRTSNLYTTIGGTAATVVTEDAASYYLGADTEDVDPNSFFVRRSSYDTLLRPLSQHDFAGITDKATRTGKPEAYLLERNQSYTGTNGEHVGRLKITLYPIPENSTDAVHYIRWRRTEDWGSATTNPDYPWKYIEALTLAGANKLALRFGISQQRHERIRLEAAKAEEIMRNDDRERGPTRVGIDVSCYYN